jgi:hypothetical protein
MALWNCTANFNKRVSNSATLHEQQRNNVFTEGPLPCDCNQAPGGSSTKFPAQSAHWLVGLTRDGAVQEETEEEVKCQFSTESNATQLLTTIAMLLSITPFYEKDPNFLNLFQIRVTRIGHSKSRYTKECGTVKLCIFWNTKEEIYPRKMGLICTWKKICANLDRNVSYFEFRSSRIFSWFSLSIAR